MSSSFPSSPTHLHFPRAELAMNVKERVETTGTNDERVSETAQTGGEVVGGKDGTLAPREEEEGSGES